MIVLGSVSILRLGPGNQAGVLSAPNIYPVFLWIYKSKMGLFNSYILQKNDLKN